MAKVNLFNQVRDFVEKINEAGGKPLYELTPEEARGVLRGVQEAKTEEPDVERKEAEIEVGGGRMMRLEITKPKGVTGELGGPDPQASYKSECRRRGDASMPTFRCAP